jgi:hypothetical protein
VSIATAGRNLWLLGEQTGEAWFNRGSTPFPFEAHPSGQIQHGTAAPFSPAVVDGQLMFLAKSKMGQGYVVRLSGYTAEVVSTQPLQNAINGYTTISDAVGDAYNDLGHSFYLLSFPQEITHAYDANTTFWCERGTWIAEDNEYVPTRARFHAFAHGQHRWLDSNTGSVYRASVDLLEDVDERPIRRLRRAPAIVNENNRIFYPGLEVFMDVGLGTATGQGATPRAMLRVSQDGGRTWGNEVWRDVGAIGEYGTRVRWERLGQARQFVAELAVTDPIPWRLTGAHLNPEPIPERDRSARRVA